MNRWREVLCTTPMRLTLRLAALFLAISLIAFGVTWWLANSALLDATETTLKQQIEALSASDRPQDIADAVTAAAAQADAEHMILRYDGPGGPVGNYLGPLPAGKLAEVPLRDDTQEIDGSYILMRRKVAGGDLDIALIDLVWIGNFAENNWLVPSETFIKNPALADPNLDMPDFFPLVLDAIRSSGALAHARKRAVAEADLARTAIQCLGDSQYKVALLQLTLFAVERNH